LTNLCQQATLEQWTKFISGSHVIKILHDKEPRLLFTELTNNYFKEKRYPGVGIFFDASRIKKGQQAISNRLLFMRAGTVNFYQMIPLELK
jgi:hypothetical protein